MLMLEFKWLRLQYSMSLLSSQYSNVACVCVRVCVRAQDYNDEIRQAQLQELTYLNGGSEDAKVPAVRGKSATRSRGTPPAPGAPR